MPETSLLLIILLLAVLVAVVVLVWLTLRTSAAATHGVLLEEERTRLAAERDALRTAHTSAQTQLATLEERCLALSAVRDERDALRQQLQPLQDEVARAQARASMADARANDAETRLQTLQSQLQAAGEEIAQWRVQHADMQARLQHSQQAATQMQTFVKDARTQLSEAFADLAGKAFDERSQRAALQSKGDIETLLKPFAERLDSFRTRIDTLYKDEAKERSELAGAVNALKTLNEHMATSADALTRALKGSAKVRGDWGELMLENVLRSSGLEEGIHYQRQHSTTDDEGQRLQPDVVVRLPDQRSVVIDSKVNLIAWQEAMNADSPEVQLEAMRRHAVALKQHVRDLAQRNYPKAIGDDTLDITLAFVPIEGALSAALGVDGELQSYAFENKVAFASPNTLMGMLRVIERLWTRDKIQRQAVEISDAGGKVLDALIAFLADFDKVGKRLADAQESFADARKRLSESSQAVIPRARRIAELGARGKKALPEELKRDDPLLSFDDPLDASD